MPVRIVEVDQIDGGNAGLNQGEMVVHDLAAPLAAERVEPSVSATAQTSRTNRGAASTLLGSCLILRLRPPTMSRTIPATYRILVRLPIALLDVNSCELFRAEEVFAHSRVIAENQLLAVEQDQVDAPLRLQVLEVIGDFHEEGDPRCSVVGTHEREIMAIRVDFLVGVRPGIVVGADHDPLEVSGFQEPTRLAITNGLPVIGCTARNGCSVTFPPCLAK